MNEIYLQLPNESKDNIILHSTCGGGIGIKLFKQLFFKQNIIDHIKDRLSKLPKKYISIHIRNTDIKCDYTILYEENTNLLHSYHNVYVATDDAKALDFFKSKGLNVLNFTEFPDNFTRNLHYSPIASDTKIKNMLCDLCITSTSNDFVSNSAGGFINLIRSIRKDTTIISNKLV